MVEYHHDTYYPELCLQDESRTGYLLENVTMPCSYAVTYGGVVTYSGDV